MKQKEKAVKSNPCTNRPIECKQCEEIIWPYNLEAHYKNTHNNLECPEMISVDEKRYILSK